MILIAHRGNISGRSADDENKPQYIENAISLGFDVEVDIWIINGICFLGHDLPQYFVDLEWLLNIKNNLWLHCKNKEALEFLHQLNDEFNFFWHENDTATLTSKNFIWSNVGCYFNGGITVSLNHSQLPDYIGGVCSDHIAEYIVIK